MALVSRADPNSMVLMRGARNGEVTPNMDEPVFASVDSPRKVTMPCSTPTTHRQGERVPCRQLFNGEVRRREGYTVFTLGLYCRI